MQPSFHAGDLAIVRQASSYHVGEIVAYRNLQLGGHTVLHRIIAIHNGLYTFKGDNNNFVDSFHPDSSELVGRLWLHLPAAGKYLGLLHGPRVFLVAGLLALLLIGAAFARNDGKNGGRGGSPRTEIAAGGAQTLGTIGAPPVAALVALLAFAGLGALSYTRPLTTRATQAGLYSQSGRFSYNAQAAGGSSVYGRAAVTTGEPIFLRLAHQASFRFSYRFASKAAHALAGRADLLASISASDGWKRTLQLARAQTFSGDHTTVTGTLDLTTLETLVNRVGQLSGVSSGSYTLTVEPQVHVHGAVAGDPIEESFNPTLAFLLDSNQLQLQPGSAGGPSSSSLLSQSSSGSGPVTVANTIALPKLKLPVARARQIALLGGGVALVLLLAALALARSRRPRSEQEQIEQAYGELIVPVSDTPRGLELPTVTVSSIDALARLADQAGRLILHLTNDEADVYFVEDNGFVYTYQTTAPAPIAQPQPHPIIAL